MMKASLQNTTFLISNISQVRLHNILSGTTKVLIYFIFNKVMSHLSWRLFFADMSSPAEGLLFFLGGMALEQQARGGEGRQQDGGLIGSNR